jgi:tripeptidyl-peptidase I
MLLGGTSASAPTFAGLVALLNDARISAGRPPLGFLNPLIYQVGDKAFNDITAGNAPGCGTPGFNVSWHRNRFVSKQWLSWAALCCRVGFF